MAHSKMEVSVSHAESHTARLATNQTHARPVSMVTTCTQSVE